MSFIKTPPYIIAEVNSSHNGSVATARLMIDAAAAAGCDCVKFQSWSSDTLYAAEYYRKNPIAKRFVTKFSLSEAELLECARYCREKGIGFSSTPYSNREADFLAEECGAPFIKIASMEINNPPFLRYLARKGPPLVLSTGMAGLDEIEAAVNTLEAAGCRELVILHCVSMYPVAPEDVNLLNMRQLADRFPRHAVGFSDHTLGVGAAAAAAALGAVVIEKHLTLDRAKIGMDNQMATQPEEMSSLVRSCREAAVSLGSYERIVSAAEIEQRKNMRRSLVFTRDLPKGHVLSPEDLTAKRPGTGAPPTDMDKYIGKELVCDVSADSLLADGQILAGSGFAHI
jgi:N-acetylneuraminate synthase